ncbi:MAG TPA: hypothetical protein V6C85_03265 [Allocoleopsis sp.]
MTQSKIHLLSYIQGLTLLVYKDAHGHQLDALLPNGTVYRYNSIFYSASSAEAKGRQWIRELRHQK